MNGREFTLRTSYTLKNIDDSSRTSHNLKMLLTICHIAQLWFRFKFYCHWNVELTYWVLINVFWPLQDKFTSCWWCGKVMCCTECKQYPKYRMDFYSIGMKNIFFYRTASVWDEILSPKKENQINLTFFSLSSDKNNNNNNNQQ